MDGASSAIAVVSITIQLADSVRKLYDFWSSVKDAPEDVQGITTDLELLQSVFSNIAYDAQHGEPNAILTAVLWNCNRNVEKLFAILKDIEPGFASASLTTRKWSAIKFVFKEGKVKKFQDIIERLKSSLLLAQQTHHGRSDRGRYHKQQQALATITEEISSLKLQLSSRPVIMTSSSAEDNGSHKEALRTEASRFGDTLMNPVHRYVFERGSEMAIQKIIADVPTETAASLDSLPNLQQPKRRHFRRDEKLLEYFFGTIYLKTKTSRIQSKVNNAETKVDQTDQYEHESSFIVRPARWLISLGFKYGLHIGLLNSSRRGWKQTLRPFCLVRDDSLIFRFCVVGDTIGVRSLLTRGDASVRDTDSLGRTPLHFASLYHHPQLCQLLIDAGAEKRVYDTEGISPIVGASWNTDKSSKVDDLVIMDTLRIFWDQMDFSEEDGEGWDVLLHCSINPRPGEDVEDGPRPDLLLWLIRLCGPDIKQHYLEDKYSNLLYFMLETTSQDVARSLLAMGNERAIDARLSLGGYTNLHLAVASATSLLGNMLIHKPDLHITGLDLNESPYYETPTSLALYTFFSFANWRDNLNHAGVDLYKFVNTEIHQSQLSRAGWTVQNLFAVLKHDFQLDCVSRNLYVCVDCGKRIDNLEVQPYWQHVLEIFKHRHTFDEPSQIDKMIDEISSENDSIIRQKTRLDREGEVVICPPAECSSPKAGDKDGLCQPALQDPTNCPYGKQDMVDMHCWLYYQRTGQRRISSNADASTEGSSDDEFSPFLIHT